MFNFNTLADNFLALAYGNPPLLKGDGISQNWQKQEGVRFSEAIYLY